ncbi:MAG TPA: NAD(P)/FAD-dependent oxidoreductase [Woeseiaceae bacterium]
MRDPYDLVVIGTGVAATAAATRVRTAGWSVAVVDDRPFGGTCALRGCDPKKMLVGGAGTLDRVQRYRGSGIEGDVRLDWPGLLAFKRGFTGPIPGEREQLYREQGIRALRGRARFTGRNSLEVGGEPLEGKHILIASGAEPVDLGIPGEALLSTSDEFLELDVLPQKLVLVGGGYIAAEFSHIAARAGVAVTVLQRGERLLEPFDAELVGWLMEKFRALGVDVRTRTTVTALERRGGGCVVHGESGGENLSFPADLVIHAAGRAPALEALYPAAAGVEVRDGRLALNDYLQSVSNPAVYAAGDAAQKGPPLTPVSSHDGEVVAANLLEGNHRKPDYLGVPSVAFTIPPIAAVGLGEAEANALGLRFRVASRKASDWFTARQAAEPVYGFKLLVETDTDRLLGAHLVGPQVDEVINVFAMAIRHGVTATALKSTVFAYPTGASDIGAMLRQ